MTHTLLKNNQRAAAIPVLVGVLGIAASGIVCWIGWRQASTIITIGGVVAVCLSVWATLRNVIWWARPRLAIFPDELRVYLRAGPAERIPLDDVECFFIGQDSGPIDMSTNAGQRVENVTVVVRLAERAEAWHDRPVNQDLGKWEQGYITIYGFWCEPLNGDKVKQMNHQLADAKRDRKRAAAAGARTVL